MRLKIYVVLAFVFVCAGCDYDAGNAYSRPNQSYGYIPPQPNEIYGYPAGYPPYGYPPNYSSYGYEPPYYQQAPSFGLGFGYFSGSGHGRLRRDEWHEHQEHGLEQRGGSHPPPAALNMPPPAAHAPPPARPAAPPAAHSAPSAAANAAALSSLGFRPK